MEIQLLPLENRSEESDRITSTPSKNEPDEKITDIITHQGTAQLRVRMHKILPQVSLKKHQIEHVYDPVIVSLGPYHHGKVELGEAEEVKSLSVQWLASGIKEKEKIFYHKIMENIEEIRSSYAETSVLLEYDDEALALMMLRDASFIINYMASETRMTRDNNSHWNSHLGSAASPLMLEDIMKLENQVPFFVVKLLICLQQGEEWEELLHQFLKWQEQVRIPREHEDPPLHLLEAVWRVITDNEDERSEQKIPRSSKFGTKLWQKLPKLLSIKRENDDLLYNSPHVFGPAVELKTKGIRFTSSSSYSLKVVRFKSFFYYGELQLPVRYVCDQHQVMLSNLVAYEVSPDTKADHTVLSYTILMKSLIESTEDVKELQKRGILCSISIPILNKWSDLSKTLTRLGLFIMWTSSVT